MAELKTKLKANAFDSMFQPFGETTAQEISSPSNDGLKSIKIDLLKPFYNHTFKIYEGEKLQSLSDSIKENGVISPILVRPSENEKYEIISGHNRVEASKLAGMTEIPAIIKNLTNEESTVIMVYSNLEQREEILPSEKAFSYKAKLDAIKSQGKRNDLTSRQVVGKSEAYNGNRVPIGKYINPIFSEIGNYNDIHFIFSFAPPDLQNEILTLMDKFKSKTYFADYAPNIVDGITNAQLYKKMFHEYIHEEQQSNTKKGFLDKLKR